MSAPLRAITLMYHDVLSDERWDASGFPGPGAARYKLRGDEFERHLDAIADARPSPAPPATVLEVLAAPAPTPPVLLTFDDGGASADETADRLERRGWRGHFFVPTDFLGGPAFLDGARVRDLHRRGHVIGSHSASHPRRMSSCPRARILDEWRRSVAVLSDLLGERVRVASVPEGYYSEAVAETAAESGIDVLFTSEPTSRARRVAGCLVLGRHAIRRGTRPDVPAALAAGRLWPALKQSVFWSCKEVAKRVGGEHYLRLRELLLEVGRR